MPTSSTSSTTPDTTTSTEVVKPDSVTGPQTGADKTCSLCGAKSSEAPEGVHDFSTAAKAGANPGDPKWTFDKCWRCGASY